MPSEFWDRADSSWVFRLSLITRHLSLFFSHLTPIHTEAPPSDRSSWPAGGTQQARSPTVAVRGVISTKVVHKAHWFCYDLQVCRTSLVRLKYCKKYG